MTVPRELFLRPDGRLGSRPVAELRRLRSARATARLLRRAARVALSLLQAGRTAEHTTQLIESRLTVGQAHDGCRGLVHRKAN